MIRKPTVLILGAGASIEYGFPSGEHLRREIVREIRGKNSNPQSLYSLIGHLGHNDAALQRFAGLLEDSSLSSVDIFLEHRSDLAEIGKAATAAAHIALRE